MPYGRKYKKKATTRKPKKAASRARAPMYKQIQIANQQPSTQMVRFQGKQRYQCIFTPNVNGKSIMRVPMSFLPAGNPTAETGTWIADDTSPFMQDTANYFSQYNHYRVIGCKVQVTVKPSGGEPLAQANNLAFICRTDATGVYSAATTLKELEGDRAVKSRQWGVFSTGAGYRQAYLRLGYSPKKQLGIKDWQDSTNIRTITVLGTAPTENTFCNIILAGCLDNFTNGHSSAIVDIKADYIVRLEEPAHGSNEPQPVK